MSRPGIYTFTSGSVKTEVKKFWEFSAVFIPISSRELSGRARCLLTGVRTKMAESLVFLREFRSLTAGPAAHPGCRRSRPLGTGNFFGSFREFLRSLGSLDSSAAHQAPGARPPGSYPQVIHRFFYIREFGSLKALDKNRDP